MTIAESFAYLCFVFCRSGTNRWHRSSRRPSSGARPFSIRTASSTVSSSRSPRHSSRGALGGGGFSPLPLRPRGLSARHGKITSPRDTGSVVLSGGLYIYIYVCVCVCVCVCCVCVCVCACVRALRACVKTTLRRQRHQLKHLAPWSLPIFLS